jgi:hypothetical protein
MGKEKGTKYINCKALTDISQVMSAAMSNR